MKKVLFPTIILLMILTVALIHVSTAEAKFRDALNFPDNTFAEMDSMELLHRYQKITDYDSDIYNHTRLSYKLTYGVMPGFEAGIKLPVIFAEENVGDDQGIGDLEIFQKFKFMEAEEGLPEMSGGFALILPTAESEGGPFMGTSDLDGRFYATIGQDFAEEVSWLLNAAYRYVGDNDFDDKMSYNAALNVQTGERSKMVLEINGWRGGVRDESEYYASPGLLLQPQDNLSLNISSPIGLNSESADYRALIQFAVDF